MKILQRYLLQHFLPVCFVALLFFVVLLQLADLFTNLWKYLANSVPIVSIFKVMLLYVPKCISFAMPMAVLFASSYTMGNLYARNELTSIFASGYPLYQLIVPLLIFGFLLSVGMFYFEDRVVIYSLSEKNTMTRILLDQELSFSNTNLVVMSEDEETIYFSDYYQDSEKRLYNVFIVNRTQDGVVRKIIQTNILTWKDDHWEPEDPQVYSFENQDDVTVSRNLGTLILSEQPETFRRNVISVEELPSSEAKAYVNFIRRAGLPHAEQLSNYYKRFSFPFTIFIVLFFSISLGGRFKKNILLMSLLLSLSIAVSFYVMQMITMILAKWEYLSPLAGAWLPVIVFFAGSVAILRYART